VSSNNLQAAFDPIIKNIEDEFAPIALTKSKCVFYLALNLQNVH
jgi:hypothetical protein